MNVEMSERRDKLYSSLVHSINFIVALSAFFYEFIKIFDFYNYLLCCDISGSINDSSFFIYLGTLLSFFLNELVYEPFGQNKFSRRAILLSSGIGCLVTMVVLAVSTVLIKYHPYYLSFVLIARILLCLCYGVLSMGFFSKTYSMWIYMGSKNTHVVHNRFKLDRRLIKDYFK